MKINHLLKRCLKKCRFEIYELKFIKAVFNKIKM